MKHSYQLDCACHRCTRERQRRADQSELSPRTPVYVARVSRHLARHRPTWGSQAWAETRGDDLGPSGDW